MLGSSRRRRVGCGTAASAAPVVAGAGHYPPGSCVALTPGGRAAVRHGCRSTADRPGRRGRPGVIIGARRGCRPLPRRAERSAPVRPSTLTRRPATTGVRRPARPRRGHALPGRPGDRGRRPAGARGALPRSTIERVPGASWASLTVLRGARLQRPRRRPTRSAVRADLLQYELGVRTLRGCRARRLGLRHRRRRVRRAVAAVGPAGARRARRVQRALPAAHPPRRVGCHRGPEHLLGRPRRLRRPGGRHGAGALRPTARSSSPPCWRAAGRRTCVKALETNREIGVAMGILMQRHTPHPRAGLRRAPGGEPGLEPQARRTSRPRWPTPASSPSGGGRGRAGATSPPSADPASGRTARRPVVEPCRREGFAALTPG